MDTNGSTALANARVKATNLNANVTLGATTNSSGVYSIALGTDPTIGDIIKLEVYKPTGPNFAISEHLVLAATGSETAATITTDKICYTNPSKVATFMGVTSLAFTMDSNPSVASVCQTIRRVETYLENVTQHAWRAVATPDYEFYDIKAFHLPQTGYQVKLLHRTVRTLTALSGDVLEIWNGSSWEDWLANYTEGRGNDYWLQPDSGILWLRSFNLVIRPRGIRIKYRYGETTVPANVERVTTMLTIKDLLTFDDRSVLLPEGGSNPIDKLAKLDIEINKITKSLTEWVPV